MVDTLRRRGVTTPREATMDPSSEYAAETAAFERDLPALLRDHSGEYAAFVGDKLTGVSPDPEEAWRSGLPGRPDGNVFVREIVEGPQIVMLPLFIG
jgi:hypothetical protein